MRNIKTIITSILFCISINNYGQQYELIEREAANIFLLNENNSELLTGLERLKTILFNDTTKLVFENTYKVKALVFDSLKNHFDMIEAESKSISPDSALYLFNLWYLQLSNTFYDYCKEKFFFSPKTKILLLSTSMSCYCTLEMCKNQLLDIVGFISWWSSCPCSGKRNIAGNFDLFVVDSYKQGELQKKYDISFIPSVIVLDGNNEILIKIEYEEKMIEKLNEFLTNNTQGKI